MKKVFCLALSLALVLSLAACSKKGDGDGGYRFLDEDLGVESYAIGFRIGDNALAEQVNGAVKALVKNGTYKKIAENYPDIKDYLNLKAEDISDSEVAARSARESSNRSSAEVAVCTPTSLPFKSARVLMLEFAGTMMPCVLAE